MPRKSLAALVVLAPLLIAIPLFGEAGGPLAERPRVADAIALLDLWIEEQVAHQHLPGLSIAIVHDQEPVWAKGYGSSDLETRTPASPDTIYRIGSITKLFTATAILQLRDAGRLRLDDPVSGFLPWFAIQSPFAGDPEITLRHLLTHTSGLPREGAFPYWTTHDFPTREEIIEALPAQEAIHPPATEYKYSNLGIALLGEIVAAVSGRPYAEYVEEKILRPLGMKDTRVIPTEEQLETRATSYMRRLADGRRDVFDYYDTRALAPAANIVSTVEDLARFASLQFSDAATEAGNKILRGSTIREMHRPHWVHPSWTGGRGLGFSVSRREGETIVSHGGWIGGNRSHLLLMPEKKIAVIAITNADDASPSFFSYRAYDQVAPAIVKATAPKREEKKTADPAWKRYMGTYTDPWHWEHQVMILDDQLVVYEHGYPPADNPKASLTRLEPVAEHTFKLPGGELLIFELGEDGKVERIKRRHEYLYPVEP